MRVRRRDPTLTLLQIPCGSCTVTRPVAPVADRVSLKVQRVRFRVGCWRSAWSLPRQQRYFERVYYRPSDFILNLEYVIDFPVVGFRPDVVAIFDPDKLCGNSQCSASLANAAFQNVGHTECLRDLGDCGLFSFEIERRGSCRNILTALRCCPFSGCARLGIPDLVVGVAHSLP